MFSRAYPLLDVAFIAAGRRTLRLQLHCEDWNELPPSIALLDVDGSLTSQPPTGPTGVFNNSAHPATGRPFICMAGAREYHTHSSHIGDHWSNYKLRSGYDLGGIVSQIWSAWLKSQ